MRLFGRADPDLGASRNVHFSSTDSTWETPQEVFDALDQEFGFTLDVCATPETAKCADYLTPDEDAFACPWFGTCWMNPPYGRDIGRWIRRAYASALDGATVVCLVPARTDTAWFQDYCLRGEVRFLRGRLRFGGAKHNAPFPSAVVVFGGSR